MEGTMTKTFRTLVCAFSLTFAAACSGGGGLAEEAQDRSEKTCSCEGFDCTMEHIAWFNEQRIVNEDDINALSEADRASFDGAEDAAADCQNELR